MCRMCFWHLLLGSGASVSIPLWGLRLRCCSQTLLKLHSGFGGHCRPFGFCLPFGTTTVGPGAGSFSSYSILVTAPKPGSRNSVWLLPNHNFGWGFEVKLYQLCVQAPLRTRLLILTESPVPLVLVFVRQDPSAKGWFWKDTGRLRAQGQVQSIFLVLMIYLDFNSPTLYIAESSSLGPPNLWQYRGHASELGTSICGLAHVEHINGKTGRVTLPRSLLPHLTVPGVSF